MAYGEYCSKLPNSRSRICYLEKTNPIVRQKIIVCTSLFLFFFLYLIPLTSCCSTFLEDFEFTLILVANVNFRLFQDCGIAANRNQFHLQDLLSIPMQRVLKYHVLLSVIFSLFHLKYSKIKE